MSDTPPKDFVLPLNPFGPLPVEMYLEIIRWLPVKDRNTMAKVCRFFRNLLWKNSEWEDIEHVPWRASWFVLHRVPTALPDNWLIALRAKLIGRVRCYSNMTNAENIGMVDDLWKTIGGGSESRRTITDDLRRYNKLDRREDVFELVCNSVVEMWQIDDETSMLYLEGLLAALDLDTARAMPTMFERLHRFCRDNVAHMMYNASAERRRNVLGASAERRPYVFKRRDMSAERRRRAICFIQRRMRKLGCYDLYWLSANEFKPFIRGEIRSVLDQPGYICTRDMWHYWNGVLDHRVNELTADEVVSLVRVVNHVGPVVVEAIRRWDSRDIGRLASQMPLRVVAALLRGIGDIDILCLMTLAMRYINERNLTSATPVLDCQALVGNVGTMKPALDILKSKYENVREAWEDALKADPARLLELLRTALSQEEHKRDGGYWDRQFGECAGVAGVDVLAEFYARNDYVMPEEVIVRTFARGHRFVVEVLRMVGSRGVRLGRCRLTTNEFARLSVAPGTPPAIKKAVAAIFVENYGTWGETFKASNYTLCGGLYEYLVCCKAGLQPDDPHLLWFRGEFEKAYPRRVEP